MRRGCGRLCGLFCVSFWGSRGKDGGRGGEVPWSRTSIIATFAGGVDVVRRRVERRSRVM